MIQHKIDSLNLQIYISKLTYLSLVFRNRYANLIKFYCATLDHKFSISFKLKNCKRAAV